MTDTLRKGYRIHTRNTEYLLVSDDEGIWTEEGLFSQYPAKQTWREWMNELFTFNGL